MSCTHPSLLPPRFPDASSISKSARYQQFTRPSPLYVDHEEALANRKKLYSVQEGVEN